MTKVVSVNCHPSRIHLVIIFVVHLLALSALSLLEAQLWVLFSAFVVISSAIYCLMKSAYRIGNNIVQVKAELDRNSLINWQLSFQNGDVRIVELKPGARVFPWLIACQFRDTDGQYPLVLFSDSTSKDEHRQLRVFLSLYASPSQSAVALK